MVKNGWSIVYKKAICDDGSLLFPERLSQEFLNKAKRTMGTFLFANQYQNEVIPEGEESFKPEWFRYYVTLPEKKYTFAFIDPAISEQENADYTALTVIDVDIDGNWYVRNAQRFKINPTKIVQLVFNCYQQFKPMCVGIEDVAYQKALLYMLDEEMRRRNVILPVKGIRPGTDKTKEMRILSLVPRFEWGRIYLANGLYDLETELSQFPRGAHDDLLDSLSYMEQIVIYPQKQEVVLNEPASPNHPDYEKWWIQNRQRRANDDFE